MNSEIFLKLVIIFLMSIFIVLIALSALTLDNFASDEPLYLLHKSVGTLFLILLPMHIYLRKKKLKKMIADFFDELLYEKKYTCQSHKILSSLKKRTLLEICNTLNNDVQSTLLLLREKEIVVNNAEEKLEEIATNNAYDSLKIVAIILENHIRTLEKVSSN